MAIDFGMQFTEWRWDADRFCFVPTTINDDEPDERLYIHPDSLHLLEPQVGDLIKQWGSQAGVPIYDIGAMNGKPCYFMPNNSFNYLSSMERIIQRNGIAFHWPESEEA
jgi:hypothetical protein